MRQADKAVTGFVCISCFHTCNSWNIAEQRIGSADIITSSGIEIGERVIACTYQLSKHRFFDCILGNFGQVRGCCVMIITGIKTIWSSKVSVCLSSLDKESCLQKFLSGWHIICIITRNVKFFQNSIGFYAHIKNTMTAENKQKVYSRIIQHKKS